MGPSPKENENASQREWQKRSEELGDSLNGVLFKGLPTILNQHIHGGHRDWIMKQLSPTDDIAILDVGCGYGRVSEAILAERPDCRIHGMDFIQNYAKLYRRRTGNPSFVASVADLPCHSAHYDAVICVTVLMYLHDDIVGNAIAQMLAALKPGGTLILIEPDHTGKAFQTAFGIRDLMGKLKHRDRRFETGGMWFRDGELSDIIKEHGGAIAAKGNIPVTTVLFLPLFVLAKLLPESLFNGLLRIVRSMDRVFQAFPGATLYKMYAIKRAG